MGESSKIGQEPTDMAQKLDDDISKLMESFKQNPYKDGWAEGNWKEEFEKHPFFMTKPPDPTEELSPLMEGLQQIKYGNDENTPEDLANTHKDDGNFNFKCKKYRDAILNYSAGIQLKCSAKVKAQLLNNRGAAHFQLKNYRSALNDSQSALQLEPDYKKARVRIAQCYFFLEKYEECIQICDTMLEQNEEEAAVKQLKKDAISKKKIRDRDNRKSKKQNEKKTSEERKLFEEIRKRGLLVHNISQLDPEYASLPLKRVHLDGDKLVWPVIFVYPEYSTFDCIENFYENSTFKEHVDEMFAVYPEWDTKQRYTPTEINIYYKDEENNPVLVSPSATLSSCFKQKKFIVKDGVLLFHLFVKNTEEESEYKLNVLKT